MTEHALKLVPRSSDPSIWLTLERAILETYYSCYGNRKTLEWRRFALIHWCCGQRMRIARIRYVRGQSALGWTIAPWKTAACARCGHFKQVL